MWINFCLNEKEISDFLPSNWQPRQSTLNTEQWRHAGQSDQSTHLLTDWLTHSLRLYSRCWICPVCTKYFLMSLNLLRCHCSVLSAVLLSTTSLPRWRLYRNIKTRKIHHWRSSTTSLWRSQLQSWDVKPYWTVILAQ